MLNTDDKVVKVHERQEVYNGFHKVCRLVLSHTLFAGGWSQPLVRELVQRQPAVAVLLYDVYLDQVVLVEQFRVGAMSHASGAWQLELVAGIIDQQQTPAQTAVRECEEEAGIKLAIDSLVPVYEYLVSPGGNDECLAIYYAPIDASQAGGTYGLPTEGEDIKVRVLDRTTAWQWVSQGKIANASTLIALQWLQLNYQHLCHDQKST